MRRRPSSGGSRKLWTAAPCCRSNRLDPKARPRAIDITEDQGPNKGTTSRDIYLLDGDTLVVCYNLPHLGRPTAFSSRPGSSVFLFIYKRVRR